MIRIVHSLTSHMLLLLLLLLLVESRCDEVAGRELGGRLGALAATLPDQLALLLKVRVQLLRYQLVRLRNELVTSGQVGSLSQAEARCANVGKT